MFTMSVCLRVYLRARDVTNERVVRVRRTVRASAVTSVAAGKRSARLPISPSVDGADRRSRKGPAVVLAREAPAESSLASPSLPGSPALAPRSPRSLGKTPRQRVTRVPATGCGGRVDRRRSQGGTSTECALAWSPANAAPACPALPRRGPGRGSPSLPSSNGVRRARNSWHLLAGVAEAGGRGRWRSSRWAACCWAVCGGASSTTDGENHPRWNCAHLRLACGGRSRCPALPTTFAAHRVRRSSLTSFVVRSTFLCRRRRSLLEFSRFGGPPMVWSGNQGTATARAVWVSPSTVPTVGFAGQPVGPAHGTTRHRTPNDAATGQPDAAEFTRAETAGGQPPAADAHLDIGEGDFAGSVGWPSPGLTPGVDADRSAPTLPLSPPSTAMAVRSPARFARGCLQSCDQQAGLALARNAPGVYGRRASGSPPVQRPMVDGSTSVGLNTAQPMVIDGGLCPPRTLG
jgi:hypothetical protein